MQKCSHTHLHRSDPNEASDRDRSSEKNNEGKPRENTLYMLKLCRNTELFRNIMNDSVQDLLWLVDIQHIHTHTASMLCYASFKSLGLSFWHCTFRCHQRRCICVTFFFSSSVRYLVNRTMNAGMYAFTMAWSTEQMQTQSDVFWDILRIHQWYTTIVFEWSMTKKNIYPEKNTPTLKQFKFVFEKDLFILYLPFLTKSPWILTILSHTNALNAKAFSEWNIVCVTSTKFCLCNTFDGQKINEQNWNMNKTIFEIYCARFILITMQITQQTMPICWKSMRCCPCPCPFWKVLKLNGYELNVTKGNFQLFPSFMFRSTSPCSVPPIHNLVCFKC